MASIELWIQWCDAHGPYSKKANATDLERGLQRPRAAEKIDQRSTEADVSRQRLLQVDRAVYFFFFFFLRSSKNFRFAFLALNVSSQAFT